MAAIDKRSKRLGTGCLMAIAVPFATVGAIALGWMLWTVHEWREAAGWVPVPAQIVSVALQAHTGGDGGSTYETTATYRYEYDGASYTGTRVAVDTTADNIGGFQQRLYYELDAAHDRGTAVTAYVDPDDPNRAILNRELRPGLFALKGVFALAFGGVGFGLLFGARYAARKSAAEQKLRDRFPDEPWRWRAEWADGRIAGSARAAAYVAICFAVLWNLISLPAALFVPGEIADGNHAAAVALLFPLVGLGLAAWAIRAWWQLKRFKTPTLVLERMPVALGGRLKGTIGVDAEVPIATDFGLDLACTQSVTRGSGKNRRTHESVLWQKQWRVPRHQCRIGASTTIPVDVTVPAELPPTSLEDGDGRIAWRLEVTGVCPGPDLWARFEVPVFATDETPEPDEAVDEPASPLGAPDSRALEALGILYERTPRGGESWTFRRGRNRSEAIWLSNFAALWTAICIGLVVLEAPLLFPIVFTLADLGLIWWALHAWFTEYHVTLDRGMLTLVRRGFMARAPIEIPRAWIRNVRANVGMQAGNKLYYDLEVETADGKHTAASSLGNHDVAKRLARYWMEPEQRPASDSA